MLLPANETNNFRWFEQIYWGQKPPHIRRFLGHNTNVITSFTNFKIDSYLQYEKFPFILTSWGCVTYRFSYQCVVMTQIKNVSNVLDSKKGRLYVHYIVVSFFSLPLSISAENSTKLKKLFNLSSRLWWGAQAWYFHWYVFPFHLVQSAILNFC